jgi:hypothetical protein
MKNLSIDDLCSIFFFSLLFLVPFHFIENILSRPRSLAKDFANHRSQQWPGYYVA